MIWKNILLVAAGGSLGAVSRYLGTRMISSQYPGQFPIGTFIVNVVGCLLIGLLYGWSIKNNFLSSDLKLLLMTGFCGGFTTFSSFTAEGMTLLQQDRFLVFLLYFTASVVIGLAATYIGYLITR